MEIKTITLPLNMGHYHNVANTNIYFSRNDKNNQSIINIYIKKDNGKYERILIFTYIYIFCTMVILKNISIFDRHSCFDKENINYIKFILFHLASSRNIMTFQNTTTADEIFKFIEKLDVFLELPNQTSHYGKNRQRVFLSNFIVEKSMSDNSLTLLNKRFDKTSTKTLSENYYGKDYLVPSIALESTINTELNKIIVKHNEKHPKKYSKFRINADAIEALFNTIGEFYAEKQNGVETTNEEVEIEDDLMF